MKHDNTYVISYKERGIKYDVIWLARSANEAIRTFWESFHTMDRLYISDVRIYELINIEVDTTYKAEATA